LNVEELAREIAEHILFSHATDIENLTVWEMTADHIKYNDDEALRIAFDDEDRYDNLCNQVFEQIDKAVVGISWDGGETWQW
jgi:hypothetical protein